jgi:hypothetical protein
LKENKRIKLSSIILLLINEKESFYLSEMGKGRLSREHNFISKLTLFSPDFAYLN